MAKEVGSAAGKFTCVLAALCLVCLAVIWVGAFGRSEASLDGVTERLDRIETLMSGGSKTTERLEQIVMMISGSSLRRGTSDTSDGVTARQTAEPTGSKAYARLAKHYLITVKMGLMGGLTHAAYTDIYKQGTADPRVRNHCLTRNWMAPKEDPLDICVVKWDGLERLSRVEWAYDHVREHGVKGDLVECGVWRGGMAVYMKANMKAWDDETRKVFVADSFNGVPNQQRQADREKAGYVVPKTESGMDAHQWGGSVTEPDPKSGTFVRKNILTVEEGMVRDNFERFGLLDDSVKFIVGYFNDTLPTVSDYGLKKIAVLRADGDLYSSTMDILDNLYPLVSPGGVIILDDYPLPQSRLATHDFLKKMGLAPSLIKHDRLTPERDNPGGKDELNMQAYFIKP